MNSTPLTVTAPDWRPPCRYLAIEGPIGVGKTTLATLLAERWSMRALLERPQDNPFLERFYRDTARYALPTQLAFALQRERQAREIAAAHEANTPIVADFMPQKNEIFARLTLPDDEWQLYRSLAAHLDAPAPAPDLVVYLQASPEVLFSRIQKRGEPMELQIGDAYLRSLCDAYNEFFYHYDRTPVLTVAAEHLNPLDSPTTSRCSSIASHRCAAARNSSSRAAARADERARRRRSRRRPFPHHRIGPPMTYLQESSRPAVTVPKLQAMREAGEKIAMLTSYDASFAALLDRANVDVQLIGDSLGNVLQGQATTLPVTLDDIAYHTACVARAQPRGLVVADLPFGTYGTPADAFASAVKLMRAGAQMVKLEGGEWLAETVRFLVERAVPVCAHVGLTPQSVHAFGGFKVQGKTEAGAAQLLRDARAVEEAGAQLIVLEAVPTLVAAEVTRELSIPTIGIGAGAECSGQVLVLHDMLGVFPGKRPRFVKDFMQGQPSIFAAVEAYVRAVKDGSFPGPEHSF